MATKYTLSSTEQKQLREACKYMKLQFPAMAARPEVARQLIAQHQKMVAQNG